MKIGKSIRELHEMQVPNPWRAMGPWLTDRCLVMVHAWRGTGKTYFALGLAKAIACGERFLKWDNEVPFRIVYFDGEMGFANLHPRMKEIDPSMAVPEHYLRFITFEDCGGSIWNLADPADQAKYSEIMQEADIAIIDNISCCVKPIGRNDNEFSATERVKSWANIQRSNGKTVIFIHHSGKAGTQRGTSSREDNLDTVIHLTKPKMLTAEGSAFELHFEKARNFYGKEQQSIHVSFDTKSGSIAWDWKTLGEQQKADSLELMGRGWSYREVATFLGLTIGEVKEYAKPTGNCGVDSKLDSSSEKDEEFDLF
jgi:RecA-family ATPase